jgi:hypothetical protein
MDAPRLRKLSNGTLIAPTRGVPPPAPDGYVQDPGNMYVYLPYNYTCDKRKEIPINNRSCGCKMTVVMCLLNKEKVHPDMCKECTDETKSTNN